MKKIVKYESGTTWYEEDFVLAGMKEAIKLHIGNKGLDAARET